MKTLAAPAKSPNKRRAAKWIPGAGGDAAISKTQADRFTDGLLKIAARKAASAQVSISILLTGIGCQNVFP